MLLLWGGAIREEMLHFVWAVEQQSAKNVTFCFGTSARKCYSFSGNRPESVNVVQWQTSQKCYRSANVPDVLTLFSGKRPRRVNVVQWQTSQTC